MAFNRNTWLDWKNGKPCPTCNNGMFSFPLKPSKGEYLKNETKNSVEENVLGGQYYSDYIFSIHLKCRSCNETIAVTGYMTEYVSDDERQPQKEVTPLFYYPAPKIIHIPNSCPKSVVKVINESFNLFWINASSCANKIRLSIEVLLDELGIPKKGTLNSRLKVFEKTNSDVSQFLIAIKWIGNAGSHSLITKNQVLDGYELLEFALEKLFNDREDKLKKLSEEINQNLKQI